MTTRFHDEKASREETRGQDFRKTPATHKGHGQQVLEMIERHADDRPMPLRARAARLFEQFG